MMSKVGRFYSFTPYKIENRNNDKYVEASKTKVVKRGFNWNVYYVNGR